MTKVINPGEYNKKITIKSPSVSEDSGGFKARTLTTVLTTYAKVKTTSGFTLIASNSDFEKAYTNFTIRYPKVTITRDMLVDYDGKQYSIEYLNNVDEDKIELEIQAKEVTK